MPNRYKIMIFPVCGTKVGWDFETAKEQFLSYSSF